MSKRSYLDHAAGSPVVPEAAAAMANAWRQSGNPSSLHTSGRAARRLLEEAREEIAAGLGAHPSEVVLTSGGTEANNLALLGARTPGRAAVAISTIEHPSVAGIRDRDAGVVLLPVTADGHLDLAAAADLLSPRIGLVSTLWVNNETGAVQPLAALAELTHGAGALLHTDAVQAFGHFRIDFAASGLDLLSVSAHKLGGPVGIGALVVRRGVRVGELGFGGRQEARLRSGTVPVALAAGFAAAASAALARMDAEAQRLSELGRRLIAGVAGIPGCRVNTVPPCSAAIVNLSVAGTRADDVLLILDAAGIDVSTGSACSAGVHQPSEVLLAMGRSLTEAASGLRFSFGPETTAAEIDAAITALTAAVPRARQAFEA